MQSDLVATATSDLDGGTSRCPPPGVAPGSSEEAGTTVIPIPWPRDGDGRGPQRTLHLRRSRAVDSRSPSRWGTADRFLTERTNLRPASPHVKRCGESHRMSTGNPQVLRRGRPLAAHLVRCPHASATGRVLAPPATCNPAAPRAASAPKRGHSGRPVSEQPVSEQPVEVRGTSTRRTPLRADILLDL
jgi:hypothetical protein